MALDTAISTQIEQEINLHDINRSILSLQIDVMGQIWQGTQYSVPYDTAFVAGITRNNKPLFPKTLQWLYQNQNKDGSWGNPDVIADTLLSTASVITSLQQYTSKRVKHALYYGQKWMLENLYVLEKGNFIYPAGFEFLLPSLLHKIKVLRENAKIEKIVSIRKHKLSKLPLDQMVKEKTPKNFSLEFLDGVDINLDHFIEKNGSIATSPATTAWYLAQRKSTNGLNSSMNTYLTSVQNKDGGFCSFADYKLMNIPFTIYPLAKIGRIEAYFRDILKIMLMPQWKKTGVGHSQYFPMTDADDTALSLYLLEKYNLTEKNEEKYWKAIESYKRDNYYVTYPYEVVASNMVNLHVFDLYNETNHANKKQELDKLVSYFERTITKEVGIGEDKYHASPYCQNCHGVLTFAKKYPDLCEPLIDWFWTQQKENGLWGSKRESVEETVYSVLAICYAHQQGHPQELEKLTNAIAYLSLYSKGHEFPNMWLSKVAYTPIETVKAHMLAALEIYKKVTLGF